MRIFGFWNEASSENPLRTKLRSKSPESALVMRFADNLDEPVMARGDSDGCDDAATNFIDPGLRWRLAPYGLFLALWLSRIGRLVVTTENGSKDRP
jgi:hypothetical protein